MNTIGKLKMNNMAYNEDLIGKASRSRSVGEKHEEIMMRWVDLQETGENNQENWDALQKEYNDFENEVYKALKN